MGAAPSTGCGRGLSANLIFELGGPLPRTYPCGRGVSGLNRGSPKALFAGSNPVRPRLKFSAPFVTG